MNGKGRDWTNSTPFMNSTAGLKGAEPDELEKEIDESGIEAHRRDHQKGNFGRIFKKPSEPSR